MRASISCSWSSYLAVFLDVALKLRMNDICDKFEQPSVTKQKSDILCPIPQTAQLVHWYLPYSRFVLVLCSMTCWLLEDLLMIILKTILRLMTS